MKQFRWAFIMGILVLTCLGIVGWGQPSPSLVVESYFNDIKSREKDEFLELMNQIKVEHSNQLNAVDERLYELLQQIEFEVNSQKINREVAYVTITVDGPDLAHELMEYHTDLIKESLNQTSSPMNMNEVLMLNCLEEVSFSKRTSELQLMKVDGRWRMMSSHEVILYLLFNLQSGTFE